MPAPAEGDFNRVELNCINAMGAAEIWRDWRMKMEVLFYKVDIFKQLERRYHPGQ